MVVIYVAERPRRRRSARMTRNAVRNSTQGRMPNLMENAPHQRAQTSRSRIRRRRVQTARRGVDERRARAQALRNMIPQIVRIVNPPAPSRARFLLILSPVAQRPPTVPRAISHATDSTAAKTRASLISSRSAFYDRANEKKRRPRRRRAPREKIPTRKARRKRASTALDIPTCRVDIPCRANTAFASYANSFRSPPPLPPCRRACISPPDVLPTLF